MKKKVVEVGVGNGRTESKTVRRQGSNYSSAISFPHPIPLSLDYMVIPSAKKQRLRGKSLCVVSERMLSETGRWVCFKYFP